MKMKNAEFYVNQESCSGCGICIDVCPASVLEKDVSGKARFKTDFLPVCLACGQCMAVCKTKAVVANGLSYETDFFEFSNDPGFFSLVEQRRSVRRFKERPVEKEQLEKILKAISQAPHGDRQQHVEVTVINNRDKIMEALPLMADFYRDLGRWLQQPLMRYIIRRRKGRATLNTLRNHLLPRIKRGIYEEISYDYDGMTRGAHTLLLFHAYKHAEEHTEDALIFVTYATLAAQELGLGSSIIGLVPAALNKRPDLRACFGIPDDHESIVSLIVGYPKYKYQRGIRRVLKEVHWVN